MDKRTKRSNLKKRVFNTNLLKDTSIRRRPNQHHETSIKDEWQEKIITCKRRLRSGQKKARLLE